MFSFKKKPLEQLHPDKSEVSDLSDRLFFHDLVNQTHGLLLFFGHKKISGEVIEQDEIQMIEKEIKTLQSLIGDHFDYKHKNLVQTYDWVPFSYAKFAFNNLVKTYLGHTKINARFVIDGVKNDEEELIYYPAFYRILNNLIKNISESKCTEVDFKFTLNSEGVFLETKNKMKSGSDANSSDNLTRLILNENPVLKSMGLESIYHQASEHGGKFSFEIFEEHWVNHLFLPTKKIGLQTKTDKIPA